MKVGEISSSSSPSKMAVTSAAPPPEAVAHHEGGGGGEVIEMEVDGRNSIGSEAKSEGDKINTINFGGNRWPRQETLALLKIRSDMDAVFRDSSLKGPLWEEVSRKLANLGYQRSAKKCKEKFENVYKYHKRTKESRSVKSEGKHYKFFDQLQALENHQFPLISSHPQKPPQPILAATTTTDNPLVTLPTRPSDDSTTTTTITHVPTSFPSTNPTTTPLSSPSPLPTNPTPTTNPKQTNNNNSPPNMNHLFSTLSSTTSNSSTASDEDLEEKRYRKKRKWKKDYFRRLTREVLAKQEEMQKKFLEDIDKHERERAAQQDAWRIQEMTRINREHEILVQERSTVSARDATVIALLQKLTGQQLTPTQPPQQIEQPPPPQPVMQNNNLEIHKVMSNGGHNSDVNSSSRWPKAEVHALIRIRTSLESNYHENGPKATLWEEISSLMKKNGYNRSAKRCKEKWENINKYFKRVKESNKQRRPDSKTCPYFEELDAIYKEKSKNQLNPFIGSSFQDMKPNNEMMEPLMVQPEQQWRPPGTHHHGEEGIAKHNTSHNQYQEKEEKEEEDLEEDDGERVEDEGASHYEIETSNKLISSMGTIE